MRSVTSFFFNKLKAMEELVALLELGEAVTDCLIECTMCDTA